MSDTDGTGQTNPDELTNSVRVPDELPDELIDERLYNVEWLSVADAAWHFGVSNRAIQKRIAKGQLVSRREGREWRVRLVTSKWAYISVPNTPDEPPDEPVRELSEPNVPTDEPVREPSSSDNAALMGQMQSEIEHLREQLRTKDGQLEAGRIAESELRRLLLARDMEIVHLQQENRLLLTAPMPYEVNVEEEPSPAVQEPSESRQDGRTAQDEANAGISAPELREAENRPKVGGRDSITHKRWWEVWKK